MNLLEIHLLQNVVPSNLNRDDTGSPKDAIFGGMRRARLSSQAQKRPARVYFKKVLTKTGLLKPEELAIRTRRLQETLSRELLEKGSVCSEGEAKELVAAVLNGLGLKVKKDGKLEYLLFFKEEAIHEMAKEIEANRDAIRKITTKSGKSRSKKEAKASFPAELKKTFEPFLLDKRAVDLALFGRMVADRAEFKVDGACQVAHAISTHRVEREFDFYTAVDDLNPSEDAGAGMMGDVEFLSACFYRYADINLDELLENLGGDKELMIRSSLAFIEAFVKTLPTGKQNSFAAHNPPDFIAVRLSTTDAPRNLANAFIEPISATQGKDLMANSVKRLEKYWKTIDMAYGSPDRQKTWVLNISRADLEFLADYNCTRFQDILSGVEVALQEYAGG